MAKPTNNGATTSFENLLTKNKNAADNPELAAKAEAYAEAISSGYVPSEEIVQAIVDLETVSPSVASSLQLLKQTLLDTGTLNEAPVITGGDFAGIINDPYYLWSLEAHNGWDWGARPSCGFSHVYRRQYK